MGLVTQCDNCEATYLVDSLVFIELVNKNLCPCCINDLGDRLVSQLSEREVRQIITDWENES